MTTVIFKERTLFGMNYSVNCTEKSATCGHIGTVGVLHAAETLAVDHEIMHITQAALV